MEFERITPEQAGIQSKNIENCLKGLMGDHTELHGFIAARYGKIFAEAYIDPYSKDLVHSNHSLGKSYTATGIALAYTQGLLKLDEKIVDIFADEIKAQRISANEYMNQITIENVLTMTNGHAKHPGNSGKENWVYDYLLEPVVEKPGTRFMYNTTGTCLLSAIVEKKTGYNLFDYLKKFIFPKIGINGEDFRWLSFNFDGASAAPGTYSKTEDNLRLALLYMNGGMWEGEQIIAKDFIDSAMSIQINTDNNTAGILDCQKGYGYQLWACSIPGVFRFDGGQGQYAIMWPEKELVVVIHEGCMAPMGTQTSLDIVYDEIFRKISDEELPENKEEHAQLSSFISKLRIPREEPNKVDVSPKVFSGKYKVTQSDKDCDPWITLAPGRPMNLYRQYFLKDKPNEMKEFTLDIDDEKCVFILNGYAKFVGYFSGEFYPEHTDTPLDRVGYNATTARYIDENTLELKIRYLYSWFVNVITFTKKDGAIKIDIAKDRRQEGERWYHFAAKAEKE